MLFWLPEAYNANAPAAVREVRLIAVRECAGEVAALHRRVEDVLANMV